MHMDESQLDESKVQRRKAVLGPNDDKDDNDDDKMVVIVSRMMTWDIEVHHQDWKTVINHQDEEIEIRNDFRSVLRMLQCCGSYHGSVRERGLCIPSGASSPYRRMCF